MHAQPFLHTSFSRRDNCLAHPRAVWLSKGGAVMTRLARFVLTLGVLMLHGCSDDGIPPPPATATPSMTPVPVATATPSSTVATPSATATNPPTLVPTETPTTSATATNTTEPTFG